MLACSFESAERRITDRGIHTAPCALEGDSGEIADILRNAIFPENSLESRISAPRHLMESNADGAVTLCGIASHPLAAQPTIHSI